MTSPLRTVIARAMHATEALQADLPADRAGVEVARVQRAERLERSGILVCLPPRDRRALIADQLGDTAALGQTRAWLASARRMPIMVLSGPTGRGKTLAAGWALGVEGGLYFAVEELVRLCSDRRTDAPARMVGSRFIVLDDVGRELEHDVDRVRAALVELVDRRRSGRTLTLITTNLTGLQFAKRYPDERLQSRLVQSARWEGGFGGADLRFEHEEVRRHAD